MFFSFKEAMKINKARPFARFIMTMEIGKTTQLNKYALVI
jgi:hypothetical protein